MSALLMLVRGRRSLANALPVIAFAAATAIVCTVLAGTGAFYGRLGPSGFEATDPSASPEAQITPLLVICAVFACVLLVPNAIALGGAAARLSLARREKDLAAVRLVGGTRAQVAGVAVSDVAWQSVVGAVIGVACHIALAWPLSHLDFGIRKFTAAELILPWWALALTPCALALFASVSASITLTGVALSPLGIARGAHKVRMSVMRLLVWVLSIIVFFAVAQFLPRIQGVSLGAVIVAVVLTVGIMVFSVNLAGPFIVWVIARIVASLAPTPSLLVGARRLCADPRAGWRAVSGVTIALVVSGFASIVTSLPSVDESSRLMNQALLTGAVLTVGIATVLAAVSTGVTHTARVIDQASRYRSQHIAGASISQLHRARIAEIAIPVAISLAVSVFMAALVLFSLMGSAASDPLVAVGFVVSVVAALGLVSASALVSSPLVARAARARVRAAG